MVWISKGACFYLKKFQDFILHLIVCISVLQGVHLSVVAYRVQKRSSDTPDLELQKVLRLLTGAGKLA